MVVMFDDDEYRTVDPRKIDKRLAVDILKRCRSLHWECYGRCSDETSVVVTIDGSRFAEAKDLLKFLSGSLVSGTMRVDDAIRINDVEAVMMSARC